MGSREIRSLLRPVVKVSLKLVYSIFYVDYRQKKTIKHNIKMWGKPCFYLPETMNRFQKHTILLLQCNSGVEWINLQSATKTIPLICRSFYITNWKVFASPPIHSAQSQMIKSVMVEENFNLYIHIRELTFCGPAWIRPPACTWSQIYQEGKPAHCPSLIRSGSHVLWSLCCKGNENTTFC